MKDIKVSLICTLKNEETSIEEFLYSMLSQSRPPDEIIVHVSERAGQGVLNGQSPLIHPVDAAHASSNMLAYSR